MKKTNFNFASVDIGGTNVRFALFNEKEQISQKFKFDVDPQNYENTLNKIIELAKENNVDALAMCFPGPADYNQGIILTPPNLPGWVNVNIKQYLLKNSRLKEVLCENDANAMALANHYYFKQTDKDVTQFYTVSTGLGAGLVINNKIFTGAHGFAQEIARAPWGSIEDTNTYHLLPFSAELYASGTGLALRSKTLGKNWTTKEVFDNYDQETVARKVIDEGIDSLARTICSSATLLNPNLFVFGGSVSRFHKFFVRDAFELAKTYSDPNHFKDVRLEFEELGDDSALYGLYYLIRDFANKK